MSSSTTGATHSTRPPGNMFITGVAIGIGNAAAMHFAEQGWKVYGTVRDQREMEALGDGKAKLAGVYIADIRDDKALAEVAGKVAAALPAGQGLDVLLNNAGLASCAPLELTTTQHWKAVFEVNVYGSAAVTRTFLPLVRRAVASSTWGCQPRIIFMSSIVGRVAMPWISLYSASKYALEAICDSLRLELKDQGIKVVAVEPLFVKTNLPGSMWSAGDSALAAATPELRQLYEKPFKRALGIMQGIAEYLDVTIEDVVATLDRAVNQTNPAPRMPVGFQSNLFIWLRNRVLPDSWWDAVYPYAEWLQIKLSAWAQSRAASTKPKTQ